MRHAVFPGGKRIRPLLTLMACRAAGGNEAAAMAPACSVELVHCYSLVHDDLPAMDDDDLRRGRATVHKAFDEGTAILAGDALLTFAFQLLAENCPAEIAAPAVCELARAAGAAGMVGGQMDDLLAGQVLSDPAAQLLHLESLHARKTGALLLASIRLGAIVARAPADIREALDHYGHCVGLAFQIADDLLDVCGSASKTGKRVHKDQSRGKLTFPGLLGPEEALRRASQLIQEACLALLPLGTAADELAQLAHYVVERES